jgi:hypothetical protein
METMTIAVLADTLSFLEMSADDSNANVARVQTGVEEFFKNYTGLEWESADFKEEFPFNESYSVFVKNTPITKISKVAIGTDTALSIKNTNTTTTAIINVSSTGIVLTYDGTDDGADLTFATNTTISSLVTAINAVGSGWEATATSGFSSYKSSELIPRYGAEAIDSNSVDIKVPSQALDNFDVNVNTGEIYRTGGFNNTKITDDVFSDMLSGGKIFVNYTGGYTTSNMPTDVKHFIMVVIKYIYGKLISNRLGIDQCNIAGISAVFTKEGVPKEVLDTLKMYRRVRL